MALYFSLHLLFEKRLGWELYSPTSYDWYKAGFWRYSRNPFVVKQYLEPHEEFNRGDHYEIPSQEGKNRFIRKAVTFKQFKEMDWDFVLATVNQHEEPYSLLARDKDAVFIRQLGNPKDLCDYRLCRNIMSSITNPAHPIPDDVNHVLYHQEFDLSDFHYEPPLNNNKLIRSFVNCFPTLPDWPLFLEYERRMPDFTFKCHGNESRDGLIAEEHKSDAMRNSAFIWFTKPFEGYGYVVHQACAVGRPVITKLSYCKGKMCEPLLEDGATCIDLDKGTKAENAERIRQSFKSDEHLQMCENTHRRFKEIVDFNMEFLQIKRFLEKAS